MKMVGGNVHVLSVRISLESDVACEGNDVGLCSCPGHVVDFAHVRDWWQSGGELKLVLWCSHWLFS